MNDTTTTGTDTGASAATSTVQTPFGPATTSNPSTDSQAAEPTVYDLDENALIRVKGSDKPVKFGEYGRSFQAQFTKASQKAAQLERELAARQAKLDAYERERQEASRQVPNQNQPDVYDQLRQLPYLSGEDAAGVVQSIGEQFKQRDMVLLATLKKLQQMEQIVGGLHQTSTNAAFDSKIGNFLKDGGYGEELRDIATELYLAYEPGPELDEAFPRLLDERVKQVEAYAEARRRTALERARRQPFVPGRGGQAGPNKPLQLDPRANAAETAAALWDRLQPGSET